MFILTIALLSWNIFQIFYTLQVLHLNYLHRKHNEYYGLEYYEDLDDCFSSSDEELEYDYNINNKKRKIM